MKREQARIIESISAMLRTKGPLYRLITHKPGSRRIPSKTGRKLFLLLIILL